MNRDYRWLKDVLGLSMISLLNAAALRFDIEALGLDKDEVFERCEDSAMAGSLLFTRPWGIVRLTPFSAC
jgi:hypothetical protein